MISKTFCKSKMPNLKEERHKTNANNTYWLIREKGKFHYFSEGKTQKEAWDNAKAKIITIIVVRNSIKYFYLR